MPHLLPALIVCAQIILSTCFSHVLHDYVRCLKTKQVSCISFCIRHCAGGVRAVVANITYWIDSAMPHESQRAQMARNMLCSNQIRQQTSQAYSLRLQCNCHSDQAWSQRLFSICRAILFNCQLIEPTGTSKPSSICVKVPRSCCRSSRPWALVAMTVTRRMLPC